jgi:dolichyl-phosphate-mannose--protein O-mannosyl transferase
MGISLGLALSSKWTTLFGIGILGIIYLMQNLRLFKDSKIKKIKILRNLSIAPVFFILIPLLIYLSSYLPFFTGKHVPPGTNQSTYQTFIDLQQQMYWYHTNLKATHTYQSKPIRWVFNLRPVWLYVDYKPDSIANIYTLGNPIFMWLGVISIIFLILEFIKKKALSIGIVTLGYFGFFLPWIESPRIMFHYHYLPSVPFLAIAIGYTINKVLENSTTRILGILFLIFLILSFIYFFPLWTAIHVPLPIYNTYFWIPSWK